MNFVMPRKRTIASTCGLSIEFEKGVPRLVPPAMYQEVIAAGGVSETEMAEDEMPKGTPTPEALADREKAMFKAYEAIVLRNDRNDFTAGGAPHNAVLSREVGLSVQAKERDQTWVKFQQQANA